jgi:hypothetical protein
MKRYLERLKKAPVYVKIATVVAVLVILVALVIALMMGYIHLSYNYTRKIERNYPWISGGTVVTYLEATDRTWTLKVSPRTGIFIMPQILSTTQGVYYKMGIPRKGKMRGYYYDGTTDWYSVATPWYEDMNDYFYYEKTDDFNIIKPFNEWNLERPKVTSVIIDEGVTDIGAYAFYRNTNFFGCMIPDSNHTLPVRYLESIAIANSVKYIGEYAFYGCGSLPSLTIPNGVKYIGRRAFDNCYILSPVTIPPSVEYIGEEAFDGTVHINVTADNLHYISIGNVLFNKNKTKLVRYPQYKEDTAYIIPDGVTNIGASAFAYSKLRVVTIPSSVDSIGMTAFRDYSDNKSLSSIIVLNPIPPVAGMLAFGGIESYSCLYVPEGSKTAYSLAAEWKEFKSIKAISVAREDKIIVRESKKKGEKNVGK